MSRVIWQAVVREEMLGELTDKEIMMLIDELDDAVAAICENYGVTD